MTIENTEIGSKSRVLVIEDEPNLLLLYKITFRGGAFEPILISAPSEGLAFFEANKATIHLVILDRDLPEMSGEIVAGRMRQISGQADDPYILMISGRGSELSIESLRAQGINDLLPKPFLPSTLMRTLTAANQRFQSPRS